MITKFDKFNLITEDPDVLIYNNKKYSDKDKDTISFVSDVNQENTKVNQIFVTDLTHKSLYDEDDESLNLAYPGRLWTEDKIISFWTYPNETLFKDIIKKLEEKTGLKIFNNSWKIEVVKTKSGKIKVSKGNLDNYLGYDPASRVEVIPIEEYIGSENVPEEKRILHMLNWKEKEKLKKEKGVEGFGSTKTAWDKPHNIKWRQALHQENKNNK